MNLEYINPFVKASQDVLMQAANEKTNVGELILQDSCFKGNNVIIIIGVAGDAKGQVVFNLSQQSACNLASRMMCGMPVLKLDEMAKSAIGELANMISGNAATIFFSQKITLDITPPIVMCGDNIEISTTKFKSVSVPLDMEDGSMFQINISLSES